MKILSVDKDKGKVQAELTKEKFNRLIDTCLINDPPVIIKFDMPDSQQRLYTKEEFYKLMKSYKDNFVYVK